MDNIYRKYAALLIENSQEEIIKDFFNRCNKVLETLYSREKKLAQSAWNLDERIYELHMSVFYERYCYGLSIIADKFTKASFNMFSPRQAQSISTGFSLGLNQSADTIFERYSRMSIFKNGTDNYYSYDCLEDDDNQDFWDDHADIYSQIIEVRENFPLSQKNIEHGFEDQDNIDDDEMFNSKDFLHIKRIFDVTPHIDAHKILLDTKNDYLPLIVKEFEAKFVEDLFAEKKSWKFWQR